MRRDIELIAELRRELVAFDDERARAIGEVESRLSSSASPAQVAQVRELAGALFDAAEERKRLNDLDQLGGDIWNRTRTSAERLQDELNEIAYAYREGAIDADSYARAVAQAYDKAGDAISGLKDELVGAGQAFAKQFAAWAVGLDQTEFSVRRLAQTIGSGIIEKAVNDQMVRPLSQLGGNVLDWLGSYLGLRPAAAVPGGSAGLYHGGGMAGREPSGSRAVPDWIFAGAPRFHDGRFPWLQPGELPAILKDDETVLTPGQLRAVGERGDQVVQIIDQRGASAPPIETRRTRGPNGQRMIQAFVRGEQAAALGDGSMDAAMAQNYGIGRQPVRRS